MAVLELSSCGNSGTLGGVAAVDGDATEVGYGGVPRGPRQCNAREVCEESLKLQALNSWS